MLQWQLTAVQPLAVSVFFEEDRAQHLWRMDEYLIEDFLPRVRAFAAALAES